jgi:hypothetical protein
MLHELHVSYVSVSVQLETEAVADHEAKSINLVIHALLLHVSLDKTKFKWLLTYCIVTHRMVNAIVV